MATGVASNDDARHDNSDAARHEAGAVIGELAMKASLASLIAAALLAVTVTACGHAEQQRQAQEYERFLKVALGTVETDTAVAPVHAKTDSAPAPVAD